MEHNNHPLDPRNEDMETCPECGTYLEYINGNLVCPECDNEETKI